jgi:hypothetical protein
MSLVCATKLSEGLKSILSALRQSIVHILSSDCLSTASSPHTQRNFSSRSKRKNHEKGEMWRNAILNG